MSSMLDTILKQVVGTGAAQTLGESNGADTSSVETLLSSALPLLVNTMASNASDEKGAESLAKALDDHADTKTTGSSLLSLLTDADTDDGSKILSHILGGTENTEKESKKLAKKSGLSTTQVISILSAVAPLLLSLLGNTKKKTNTSASGLSSLLSLFTGSGTTSSAKSDTTGELAGQLLSSLLGGSTSSSSKKSDDSTAELLTGLLGNLLK
ncbi:MAG: DUF937 domain-containing protein [Oscillospiraceae bacterium]|nr:DUF937 domain-containing protein [Oscillospiraceae bacterium]